MGAAASMTGSRWFRTAAPSAATVAVLECVWWARAAGEHRLVPDGCMDLLWLPGPSGRGSAWLCGPDTHSWSFSLPPGTPIAGVRFRAGAAPSVFRVAADSLRDRRARVEDLLGARAERALLDRIEHVEADAGSTRATVLEAWVTRRAGAGSAARDQTARIARSMREGATTVEALASRSGLSTRQLHRRFAASVGYGPAFYGRVARLQRFIRLAAPRPSVGVAALAVYAGYADQAHLARDCRELAGTTPTALRSELLNTSASFELERVRFVQDRRTVDASRWSA